MKVNRHSSSKKGEVMEYLLKILLIAGMVAIAGCSQQGFKFERYSSKDADLDITLDYISGWKVNEQKGSFDSFSQVVFLESERGEKTLPAVIVLTVKRESKVKFSPKTIDAAYTDIVNKRKNFKDSKVLSESKIKLLGEDALEFELSYRALDLPESLKAKLVPMRERVIVFKKNDKFYILRYENFAVDFDKFNPAFSQIIKTMQFKEHR